MKGKAKMDISTNQQCWKSSFSNEEEHGAGTKNKNKNFIKIIKHNTICKK